MRNLCLKIWSCTWIFNLSVLTEGFQHKPLPVLIHTRGAVAALKQTHQVGFSDPSHNREGMSSEARSHHLTQWETQQRLCSCGAGEPTESLHLSIFQRKKLLKGLSAVILSQTNIMAFWRHLKPNQTLRPVLLAKC